ncbi:alpha-hydroxyketone-type quorum-sensing autoinducer synthase [Endothiovibrio diazotrophicus]
MAIKWTAPVQTYGRAQEKSLNDTGYEEQDHARYFRKKKDLSTTSPRWLSQRVQHHYRDRMANDWGGRHILRGKAPNTGSVLLMSNDYLGLSGDPRIADAQTRFLKENGCEVMMSSLFFSVENHQWTLEQELAEFIGYESTIVTQSGYTANLGLIQSIADENTPVYIDQLAHRSLYEGILSARATPHLFRHNTPSHLIKQIERYGPGVVVVDSIYSTNGSICPLKEIVPAAHLRDCVVVVDESHSLGTHGESGEGLVASLGLGGMVHFITASLAKAFCGRAGLIACSGEHSDYLRFEALPLIFSSALLPHEVEGLRETLKIIREEHWRRRKIARHADRLRNVLANEGYDLCGSESQIISIEAGSEASVIHLRDEFEKDGLFGAPFMYPATAKKRALLRMSLHANLSDLDIERVIRTGKRIANHAAFPIRALQSSIKNQQIAI